MTTAVAIPHPYTDNDPLNKVDPTGLRPTDNPLLDLFDGWWWQDSFEECQARQMPTGGATTTGTTTPGPSCAQTTVGPSAGQIQSTCTYGGGASCIRDILLAHGFPSGRSGEVISYFCGGAGDTGSGCDPGYALDDPFANFLLIDLPVSILTGGIAGAIKGGGSLVGGSLVSKGATSGAQRLVIVDTNMVLDRAGVEALLAAGEKPVITQATRAELNNLVAAGRIKMPHWASELEVIDDVMNVNLRINIRAGVGSTKGLAGDGMIGATAAERGLPIITRDRNFAKFLEYLGVEVRRP